MYGRRLGVTFVNNVIISSAVASNSSLGTVFYSLHSVGWRCSVRGWKENATPSRLYENQLNCNRRLLLGSRSSSAVTRQVFRHHLSTSSTFVAIQSVESSWIRTVARVSLYFSPSLVIVNGVPPTGFWLGSSAIHPVHCWRCVDCCSAWCRCSYTALHRLLINWLIKISSSSPTLHRKSRQVDVIQSAEIEYRLDTIHLAWFTTNAGEKSRYHYVLVVSMCSRLMLCVTLVLSLIRSWRWRITCIVSYVAVSTNFDSCSPSVDRWRLMLLTHLSMPLYTVESIIATPSSLVTAMVSSGSCSLYCMLLPV